MKFSQTALQILIQHNYLHSERIRFIIKKIFKEVPDMYQKIKRLLALLAVIIILLLYLAAFILSLFHNEKTEELLMISLVATVVIPVLLYIYLWLFRLFQKKSGEDQ